MVLVSVHAMSRIGDVAPSHQRWHGVCFVCFASACKIFAGSLSAVSFLWWKLFGVHASVGAHLLLQPKSV